jgi:hypothetical protein
MASGNPEPNTPSRFSGGMPNDTPIEKLGITTEAAALLTPAAAQLKKRQLVSLREHPVIEQVLKLHVKDIDSIRAAFSHATDSSSGTEDLVASGCCCTPCCCAASTLTRDTKVA